MLFVVRRAFLSSVQGSCYRFTSLGYKSNQINLMKNIGILVYMYHIEISIHFTQADIFLFKYCSLSLIQVYRSSKKYLQFTSFLFIKLHIEFEVSFTIEKIMACNFYSVLLMVYLKLILNNYFMKFINFLKDRQIV